MSTESSIYEQTSESVLFQPQLEPQGELEPQGQVEPQAQVEGQREAAHLQAGVTAQAPQQAPQQPSQWRLRAEGMLKKMTEPEPELEVCHIAY